MRTGFVLVVVSAIMFLMAGCATALSAKSIDSQVIDARSGEPVEGAIVVGYWEIASTNLTGHSLPCGAANVEEAVTDGNGKFHLDGWGPIQSACGGRMSGFSPKIYVYKPGYYYGAFNNGEGYETVTVTDNYWRDDKMEISKFDSVDLSNSHNGYSENFDSLNTSLEWFTSSIPSQCNWKKMPHMIRVLALQEQAFKAAGNNLGGLVSTLIVNDASLQKDFPQCGSPKVFIEELLK